MENTNTKYRCVGIVPSDDKPKPDLPDLCLAIRTGDKLTEMGNAFDVNPRGEVTPGQTYILLSHGYYQLGDYTEYDAFVSDAIEKYERETV